MEVFPLNLVLLGVALCDEQADFCLSAPEVHLQLLVLQLLVITLAHSPDVVLFLTCLVEVATWLHLAFLHNSLYCQFLLLHFIDIL